MTCDELDDYRNEGRRGRKVSLSGEALEHLSLCGRCRALQTIWNSPDPEVAVPERVEARISETILRSLKPVSPLPSDLTLITGLLLLAALAVAMGILRFGFAGWEVLTPWQSAIIFVLLSGALILVAHVVVRQMIPGALQRVSPAAAIGGAFVAVIAAVVLLFPYRPDPKFVSIGIICWRRGLLTAAGTACLFYPILRRSAAMSPLKLGAATGCLSGLAGLTMLEIYCPYLDRGHVGVWHIGAVLTATLLGVAIAAAWPRARVGVTS